MQITRRGPASAKQMLRAVPASMVTIMDGTCLGSALPGPALGQSPHLATAPHGIRKEFSPEDRAAHVWDPRAWPS